MRITSEIIALLVGKSKQAVKQWFARNNKSLRNIDDIRDYLDITPGVRKTRNDKKQK